jgi:hypothetical protein
LVPHVAAWGTYKINANRRDVALSVCVICKPEEQARLSNTRVTDEQELEKVVVSNRNRYQYPLGWRDMKEVFAWTSLRKEVSLHK